MRNQSEFTTLGCRLAKGSEYLFSGSLLVNSLTKPTVEEK